MTIIVLAALAVLYLLVCLGMFTIQGRLVFQPTKGEQGTPAEVGLAYEDCEFRTVDHVRLHGWWLPPRDQTRPVLLYCHGNAGNLSSRVALLEALAALDVGILAFDYRGYGRSRGRPGERGTYLDAAAAWDHLTGALGITPRRIVLFGRSLGTAVAIELAGRVEPAGVVLEGSFTSLVDIGVRSFPWLPVRVLARIHYDSADRIRDVRCPKLFLHSPRDEVVPYGLGLRLFRAAGAPKSFVRLKGSHDDTFRQGAERYGEAWRGFLKELGFDGGG